MRVLGVILALVGGGLLYLAITGKSFQDVKNMIPTGGSGRLGFGDFRTAGGGQ